MKPSAGTTGILFNTGAAFDQNITNPAKTKRAHVNTRQAIEQREPLGSTGDCDVTMEVAEKSSVSIIATNPEGDTEESCSRAEKLSEKLEALLPK